MEVDERIADLESRLAFQDDTIQALNDVVVRHQQALDRLRLQVDALIKRQEELSGQLGVEPDELPPPHY